MTTTIIITSIVSILIFSLLVVILTSINEDAGLYLAGTIWIPIAMVVAKILHTIVFTVCKMTLNRYAFYYLKEDAFRPHFIHSFVMTPKMAERFKQSSENEMLNGYSIVLLKKGKDFKSMPYLKEDLLTEKKIKTNWNGITFEEFFKEN